MQAHVIALVALAIALLGAVLLLFRQQAAVFRQQEQLHSAEKQLADLARLTSGMSQEMQRARLEASEQSERARAQAAREQAQALTQLQTHLNEVAGMTQKQLESTRQAVDLRLTQLGGTLSQELGSQGQVMLALQTQLGGLAESAKQMHALGKDISSLQDILRAPKLRGNLGEMFLAEILRQVLPQDAYQMQYRFPATEPGTYVTVDAIIRLGDRLVPIDSKFPLDSFRRLIETPEDDKGLLRRSFLDVVKKHIDDVADKYIRPDAGTYDFAIAYLPAENVYYEAIVRDAAVDGKVSVTSHAASRKVIVCSPNTMYAYLLTVAYGLRGMRIEKQAEAIQSQLQSFHKKFQTFFTGFEKVGRNLELASRGYDDALKRATKLQDHMERMNDAAHELEAAASSEGVDASPSLPPAPEPTFPA